MSRFTVSTNHPLIPNANEYMYEKQFISIHSEDRNQIKFPLASDFEIELPQDYCNVQGVKLDSWSFPSNYTVFSFSQNNISLIFKIFNPYNPDTYNVKNPLLSIIRDALLDYEGQPYIAVIENGFYNPFQMATELTNRMNSAVSIVIENFIKKQVIYPNLLEQFNKSGGYNQFVVVFNSVGQKLWFGNKSSNFILSNSSSLYSTDALSNSNCIKQQYPDCSNWGLPAYLGFTKCDTTTSVSSNGIYPRFYFGDANTPGDNGYWLTPDSQYIGNNANIPVYYLEAPFTINIMGQSYFYLEIEGMNTIDELIPFSANCYTTTTNGNSGVVKAAFAKIPVTTTPIAQWFDNYSAPTKIYNPPAERIRKLKLRVRYHNGSLVDFGTTDYSILLEFALLRPQNRRESKTFTPEIYANN
jgi:hypothetical protein